MLSCLKLPCLLPVNCLVGQNRASSATPNTKVRNTSQSALTLPPSHLQLYRLPTLLTQSKLLHCLGKHFKAIAPPYNPPATRYGQPHARRCHGQVSAPRDEVRRKHTQLTLSSAVRDTPNLVSPATTLPPSSSQPRSQQKAPQAELEAQDQAVQLSRTSPPS